jgi:hypothetical protein
VIVEILRFPELMKPRSRICSNRFTLAVRLLRLSPDGH